LRLGEEGKVRRERRRERCAKFERAEIKSEVWVGRSGFRVCQVVVRRVE
jgi:hypothetical protein